MLPSPIAQGPNHGQCEACTLWCCQWKANGNHGGHNLHATCLEASHRKPGVAEALQSAVFLPDLLQLLCTFIHEHKLPLSRSGLSCKSTRCLLHEHTYLSREISMV